MGYTTDFFGKFAIDRCLSKSQFDYVNKFSETRRMNRDSNVLKYMKDPIREAVNLPLGVEGEYFVGELGYYGQQRDRSIIDYNKPPYTQPGLWCQWVLVENVKDEYGNNISTQYLEWNGAEKFYHYPEWLEYLIANFFIPWGYVLNGEVEFQGEDSTDRGVLVLKNNILSFGKELSENIPNNQAQKVGGICSVCGAKDDWASWNGDKCYCYLHTRTI
jgi:hypothetical protein